jgi:hypothetical protein
MNRSAAKRTSRVGLGAAILLSVLGILGASNAVRPHAETQVAAWAR